MTKNKKGFTIIEVVLVLAIAGLIFLMVFIALPALQRSQRNTRRRQDLSRFVAAINDYQSNNHGKLPNIPAPSSGNYADENTDWVKKYIIAGSDEGFSDPDGRYYGFSAQPLTAGASDENGYNVSSTVTSAASALANHNVITFGSKLYCEKSEGYVNHASGDKFFVLLMALEGGSIACYDNQ